MNQDESQNVEYKRSWHDDYLRWVCGFANAKGGALGEYGSGGGCGCPLRGDF